MYIKREKFNKYPLLQKYRKNKPKLKEGV